MDVNWDAGKFLLELLQFVITVVVAIWAAVRFGQERNKSAIDTMDQRQDELERRILMTEKDLEHAATHDDIAKLQSQFSALDSKLTEMNNTLKLIHSYMLKGD